MIRIYVGIVVSVLAIGLLLFIRLAWDRCAQCGSIRTFNWWTKTPNTNGTDGWYLHKNQYCFSCAEWTKEDYWGWDAVSGTIRHRIAEWHRTSGWGIKRRLLKHLNKG